MIESASASTHLSLHSVQVVEGSFPILSYVSTPLHLIFGVFDHLCFYHPSPRTRQHIL